MYVVNGDTALGVPLISPFEMSKDKPAGSVGWISQLVTAPPLTVGVTAVIALPTSSMKEFVL